MWAAGEVQVYASYRQCPAAVYTTLRAETPQQRSGKAPLSTRSDAPRTCAWRSTGGCCQPVQCCSSAPVDSRLQDRTCGARSWVSGDDGPVALVMPAPATEASSRVAHPLGGVHGQEDAVLGGGSSVQASGHGQDFSCGHWLGGSSGGQTSSGRGSKDLGPTHWLASLQGLPGWVLAAAQQRSLYAAPLVRGMVRSLHSERHHCRHAALVGPPAAGAPGSSRTCQPVPARGLGWPQAPHVAGLGCAAALQRGGGGTEHR